MGGARDRLDARIPATEEQAEVTGVDDDGDEYEELTSVYAERGEERRLICDVAAKALGLKPSETF
jgi:hypothetical protein